MTDASSTPDGSRYRGASVHSRSRVPSVAIRSCRSDIRLRVGRRRVALPDVSRDRSGFGIVSCSKAATSFEYMARSSATIVASGLPS
jgi:hypothetical protein